MSTTAQTARNSLVGMRVRLEYQGEGLEPYLPLEGTITALLPDRGSNSPWAVVHLDKPLEYQYKLAQPYVYRLVRSAALLIRARLVGFEAGWSPEASVHVMIPLSENALSSGEPDWKALHHAAWANCRRIP
jgi:hypothetical protein